MVEGVCLRPIPASSSASPPKQPDNSANSRSLTSLSSRARARCLRSGLALFAGRRRTFSRLTDKVFTFIVGIAGTRTLRRTPLFTLTAVLSLGSGIAGTAVVFSLADAYLLRNRRPGISNPHGLAEVGRIDTGGGPVQIWSSMPPASRKERAAYASGSAD